MSIEERLTQRPSIPDKRRCAVWYPTQQVGYDEFFTVRYLAQECSLRFYDNVDVKPIRDDLMGKEYNISSDFWRNWSFFLTDTSKMQPIIHGQIYHPGMRFRERLWRTITRHNKDPVYEFIAFTPKEIGVDGVLRKMSFEDSRVQEVYREMLDQYLVLSGRKPTTKSFKDLAREIMLSDHLPGMDAYNRAPLEVQNHPEIQKLFKLHQPLVENKREVMTYILAASD